jgi:hypothetical protein
MPSEPAEAERPARAERAGPEPIGAYLARQRALRGIRLEDLESLTRIPRRSLERLEAGHFDANPDGFVRGFVRTVATALGLDPDETVNRMLSEPAAGRGARTRRSARGLAALALAALAAALGAALTVWAAGGDEGAAAREEGRSSVRVRRDPVRALAEAEGLPGGAGARAVASGLLSADGADRDPGDRPASR